MLHFNNSWQTNVCVCVSRRTADFLLVIVTFCNNTPKTHLILCMIFLNGIPYVI